MPSFFLLSAESKQKRKAFTWAITNWRYPTREVEEEQEKLNIYRVFFIFLGLFLVLYTFRCYFY